MQIRLNNTIKIFFSMFFLSAGCKILGFLRQMLLANYFGTSDIVDSYVLAQSIPNILFGGVLVAFGSSYMPLLSKRYENEGLESANKYTSHILTIVFIMSAAIAAFGIIFSSQITSIMASGLNENAKTITSQFVKFTFGYTYFAASAAIYSNYLQYKGIFSRQLIGDYIQNIFFIAFIWIAYRWNSNCLILGLFFGYMFRVLYLRILVGSHDFKYSIKVKGIWDDLKEVKKYAIPVFLATTANEINAFVDRTLASRLDSGSISSLNYAHQLSTVFMELTITIIATVIFPKLVQTYTRKEISQYQSHVKHGMILCALISIPLAIGCVTFSRQIIEIIFERGAFVSAATVRTGSAFLFYSIGIIPLAICTYLGRVYYSGGDMKTPMICAAVGVVVNILGDFILVGTLRENGLALATSVASVTNAILLLAIYCKRIFNLFGKEELTELIKIFISSIITIGLGLFLSIVTSDFNGTLRKASFVLICIFSVVVYIALLLTLKVKEIRMLMRDKDA